MIIVDRCAFRSRAGHTEGATGPAEAAVRLMESAEQLAQGRGEVVAGRCRLETPLNETRREAGSG
jgi:hypothetical protein